MATGGQGVGYIVVQGEVLLVQQNAQASDQMALWGAHYLVSTVTGAIRSLGEIVEALNTRWRALTLPLLATTATYKGVQARVVLPEPGSGLAWSNTSSGPGTATGDLLSRQTSGIIQKLTALGGRRNRGRMYPGFPSVGSNGPGGIPTVPYQTALASLAAQMGPTFDLTVAASVYSLKMVILHGPDKNGNPPPSLTSDVSQLNAVRLWATQRRRGSYGRSNINPIP